MIHSWLGITTRAAILLLSASKSQMVKAAADRREDAWFQMLEDLHGASEVLSDFSNLLKSAYARGMVAAGVMSVKEQRPTPRSPGRAPELLAAVKAEKARRVVKRRKAA